MALIYDVNKLTSMVTIGRLMSTYEGKEEIHTIIGVCNAMIRGVNRVFTYGEP